MKIPLVMKDESIFVITVYLHGDSNDDVKDSRKVEVRAGKTKIKSSDRETIPWKQIYQNELCGRFEQVLLL